MNHMIWLLVAVLLLFAIQQFSASRSAYRKLNALNEYVQFLIFHPEVYEDHRKKFLAFVSENSDTSVTNQAMASYRAIEDIATKLEKSIVIANVKSRGSEGDSNSR